VYKFFKKLLSERRNKKHIDMLGINTELAGSFSKRKYGATITIGNDCLIQGTLVTETEKSVLIIGSNVFIGGGTVVDCVKSISICDDVLIAGNCLIMDSDNHSVSYSVRKKDLADWRNNCEHDWTTTNSKAVKLGKGCWIGASSIILKGVEIGEGSVVGAGSVVTKSIEPYSVWAGNPAQFIRSIPLEER
jgi:galactoside O-acetyltransferase